MDETTLATAVGKVFSKLKEPQGDDRVNRLFVANNANHF